MNRTTKAPSSRPDPPKARAPRPSLPKTADRKAKTFTYPPPGRFRADEIREGDPYELSEGRLIQCLPTGGRGADASTTGAESTRPIAMKRPAKITTARIKLAMGPAATIAARAHTGLK